MVWPSTDVPIARTSTIYLLSLDWLSKSYWINLSY
jgi:hypothetical protein